MSDMCVVSGAPLNRIHSLLTKVLGFSKLDGAYTWHSGCALSDEEWSYVREAVSNERLCPVLEGLVYQVNEPLPRR